MYFMIFFSNSLDGHSCIQPIAALSSFRSVKIVKSISGAVCSKSQNSTCPFTVYDIPIFSDAEDAAIAEFVNKRKSGAITGTDAAVSHSTLESKR